MLPLLQACQLSWLCGRSQWTILMEVVAEEEVLAARRELSWFPQPSKGQIWGWFGPWGMLTWNGTLELLVEE